MTSRKDSKQKVAQSLTKVRGGGQIDQKEESKGENDMI